MLKTIALVVVLLVAAVLGYAATKPDAFRVERATTIKAPPAKVHALISDLKHWTTWSPWEKRDPAMKRTYGAVSSGKGAVYAWEGNKEVGAGRMEITESAPEKLVIKLDFLQPFEAHNTAEFTLVPQGESARVTWAMHGPAPFVSKVMQVFVSMDRMVGKDFETGLANLKAAAEK